MKNTLAYCASIAYTGFALAVTWVTEWDSLLKLVITAIGVIAAGFAAVTGCEMWLRRRAERITARYQAEEERIRLCQECRRLRNDSDACLVPPKMRPRNCPNRMRGVRRLFFIWPRKD